MKIHDLLKSKRLSLGLTMKDVAEAVGVSEATVSRWESGEISNMKRSRIYALSKVLKISPIQIMGVDDEMIDSFNYDIPNILPINRKRVPLLGSIACGEPIFAEQEWESYVECGTEIKADFCLRAQGDSMIGARIQDGDIVFIRSQSIVNNGEIAAVIIDDSATLKRVYYTRETQKLVLQAENPKYAPLVYIGDELEQVRILGKAIAFQSDVR